MKKIEFVAKGMDSGVVEFLDKFMIRLIMLKKNILILSFSAIFSLLVPSFAFSQQVTENEEKCAIRLSYPQEDNQEEIMKLNYAMRFLTYKTGKLPDMVIRQSEGAYVEFNMDKSCREILQMIIEKL